ncbi:MAG: hypothetical protein AAFR44_16335, partial [Pseudomonadota bacterium]
IRSGSPAPRFCPRIGMAYRDALIFAAVYVAVIWVVLWLATPFILEGFGVAGAGVEVVTAFTAYGAAAWLFSGWLFVSNAACNNLGHPLWSTGFNWSRDGAVIPLLALLFAALGASSAGNVITIQAISALSVGIAAVVITGRFLMARLEAPAGETTPTPVLAPFTSGRAAMAGSLEEGSGRPAARRTPPDGQ